MKDLREIKVLILVGGLGTRLRSIVKELPKPMAPIGGRPFLYYKVKQLKRQGLEEIIFCSGYKHELIENYFGDGSDFGVHISYSIEENPLGTAGAIKNAKNLLNDDPFFVLNGDTYLDVNLKDIYNNMIKKNAEHCMLLAVHHRRGHEGVVLVDKNLKIVGFIEKPDREQLIKLDSPYINGGIYLLSPEILKEIPEGVKVSLEKDIFPEIAGPDSQFYGVPYPEDGYFIDIGVPENYRRFINDVKNKIVQT